MLRTLFFLAVLAPAILLAIRSQYFALLLYLWFTFAAPLELVWTDLSMLRLSLVLGLFVAVPRERWALGGGTPPSEPRSWRDYGVLDVTHPLCIGTILFLATALIAQVGAVSPSVGWRWVDHTAKLFLATLTAVSLISTERRLRWVLIVMGGSVAMNAAKVGIGSLLSGGIRHDDGLRGAFSDNNGFALMVAMALPMIAAAAQFGRSRLIQLGWWAAAGASTFALVSTFSRGGFLSLIAVGLTFLLLQRRRIVWLVAVACVAAVALLVVPIPEGYVDRLSTIRTYEQVGEASAMSRLHLWRVAVNIVREYPLGVGLFNYEVVYDQFDTTFGLYGKSRSVHSSHFQVLADQGYLGAVVWIGLFAAAFFYAFRARARANDPARSDDSRHVLFTASNALIGSMVGFLVGGSFLAAALNEYSWFTFSAIAALDRLAAMPVQGPSTGSEALTVAPVADRGLDDRPRFRGAYRREHAADDDRGGAES
jgi:probable O-glycosylation ligase (exosortase A-associated)